MRIALITEFYYPHLGGVTEHVHNLALQLNRLGHSAVVITSNMEGQNGGPPFVRRVGTSRVVFSNGSFARITTGRGLTRRLGEILSEERTEVIHLHCPLTPTFGLIIPPLAARLEIPIVATFHSWFPDLAFYRFLVPLVRQQMDRIRAKIAVSEPVVNAFSRYFQTDWEIIPNGVNVGYFHPNGRSPADALTRGPRLLFLGRLDPRNGLRTILEAMPLILAHYPSAHLLVAGDGPLRGLYERWARPLGSHVQFLGYINDERPECYGSVDLYLCPTKRASFGITLLEAMASGTPMIVSDIIGFRELVKGGDEAVLVPANRPEAWAKAAVELIDDEPRRAAMAKAGIAKSAQYAWPLIVDRVLQVYKRVRG
jgi:phosphatidylinositol alpha-mannosyltransferase